MVFVCYYVMEGLGVVVLGLGYRYAWLLPVCSCVMVGMRVIVWGCGSGGHLCLQFFHHYLDGGHALRDGLGLCVHQDKIGGVIDLGYFIKCPQHALLLG